MVHVGGADMDRPRLNKVPFDKVFKTISKGRPCDCIMTMSVGQWNERLQAAYDQGFVLWELDDNGIPVATYRNELELWFTSIAVNANC